MCFFALVCSDAVTHRMKGKTVMDQHERAESLRHCRWVDEVVENAPWVIDRSFLEKHKVFKTMDDDDDRITYVVMYREESRSKENNFKNEFLLRLISWRMMTCLIKVVQ